jgi:seryl-tRNA synthetase
MLDIKFIRENLDKVKKDTANKNLRVDFDLLLKLDDQRRNIISKIDELRAGRNKLAEAMKKERNPEMIEESRKNKEEVIKLEKELEQIGSEYEKLLLSVPNVVAEDVPVGKNEDENVVLRKWGEPKKFDFKLKDHIELGRELDIIDTEKSALISGPRFFYLKNAAVSLQFAIINLVLTTLADKKIISKLAKKVGNPSDKPFSPILPPVVVKPQIMKKMDRLDPIEERYYISSDDVVLIGSAEHTMGPLHMDETLDENNLPIRYIGYSTAFRREAGSYGKDMKGIFRTHQFDKLEMESYATPELGKTEQDLIVAIQEYLLQQLELPYQVMSVCTGDSGKPDYRQIDMECWIPSQNKYRETHTSDFMTDYQSRRLNIKCKNEKGEKRFVYMNDATAFAIGRILIAILENNQTAKGTIIVPKVLRKFTGIKEIKKKD